MESKKKKVQVVGPGKAGCSLGTALERKGWIVHEYLGKTDDLEDAAQSVDLLVIATPDEVISTVSRKIQPNPSTVIAHLSGVLGLDVLAPHNLRMGLHPLASLPNPERGADLLESGIWFGITGDPLGKEIVDELGGKYFHVADEDKSLYHAVAVTASNHLTSLLGQVERIAKELDIPFEAFLNLALETMKNIETLGPSEALTGPASRGDSQTIALHLQALPEDERSLYKLLSDNAKRLSERKE